MPSNFHSQTHFSSGALGRRLHSRIDSDLYRGGLSQAINAVITPQGSVKSRWSMQYVTPIDARNDCAELIEFPGAIGNNTIIEAGNNWIVPRVNGQTLVGGDSSNLVEDPSWDEELARWDYDHIGYTNPTPLGQSKTYYAPTFPGDGSIGMLWNVDGTQDKFWSATIKQRIAIPAGSETTNHSLDFDVRVYLTDQQVVDLGGNDELITGLSVRTSIGTAEGLSDIALFDDQIIQDGIVSVSEVFAPGAGNSFIWVEIGVYWDLNETGITIDNAPFRVFPLSIETTLNGGSGLPIEFASPWTKEQLKDVQVVEDSAKHELWLFHESVETHRLRFFTNGWAFEPITAIAGYQASSSPWGPDEWPKAGAIHQGRLWAGRDGDLWASESGNYLNFDNSASSVDSDPLYFPQRISGEIRWIASTDVLVIGTDLNEIVGSSSGPVITFSDFKFDKETHWGSAAIQPVFIGNELVFIDQSKTAVRNFAPNDDAENIWRSEELSITNPDLFDSGVQNMVWASRPDYTALFLMGDGTLTGLTYYPPWKVAAPYQITTQGLIRSIARARTFYGADIWAIVERDSEFYIEKFVANPNVHVHMDSYIDTTVMADGVVDGLDHLEGKTVTAVIDDFLADEGTLYPIISDLGDFVVSGGQITVPETFLNLRVFVGLPNDFWVITLPIPSEDFLANKRSYLIGANLNKSSVPSVNGYTAPSNVLNAPAGTEYPLVSGMYETRSNGDNAQGTVIRQTRPLYSEITGLFYRYRESST